MHQAKFQSNYLFIHLANMAPTNILFNSDYIVSIKFQIKIQPSCLIPF